MTHTETLRLALEALEYPGPSWIEARQPAITAIKAALEVKDEPVKNPLDCGVYLGIGKDHAIKHRVDAPSPQRKPLTWERVLEIGLMCANDHSRLPFEVKVARAVEADHGIK